MWCNCPFSLKTVARNSLKAKDKNQTQPEEMMFPSIGTVPAQHWLTSVISYFYSSRIVIYSYSSVISYSRSKRLQRISRKRDRAMGTKGIFSSLHPFLHSSPTLVVKVYENDLQDLRQIFRMGKCAPHQGWGSQGWGHAWPFKYTSAWTPCTKTTSVQFWMSKDDMVGHILLVSRWLKLICINSFTNQDQQFMCFGRWKQQKSVFRSRTGWTLSHLAQTCLQCTTNPLLSCLH